MNKVYVLTQGWYSDYHIVGVFSTAENAKRVLALTGQDIEEYVLDPGIDELNQGLSYWRVEIDPKSGDVRDCTTTEPSDLEYTNQWIKTHNYWATYVWARDTDHAVKIAGELRTQYLLHQGDPRG